MTARLPIGPAGDVLRQNLRRIRSGKGISYATLAARLAHTGLPVHPVGLSRSERGTRPVDVDELVAIAVVLDVSPVDLLIPGPVHDDMPWQATPRLRVQAGRARAWIGGRATLTPVTSQEQLTEAIRWVPGYRARQMAEAWSRLDQQGHR